MRSYSFLSMMKKYVSASFILVGMTALALIVANSPWGDAYRAFWDIPVAFSVGDFNLFSHGGRTFSMMSFINEFLMAVFFFAVGLEIKREMLVGELSSLKKALLPIIGACGGMLVPVLVFYVLSPSDALTLRGMAIPMATDIAFSLGVLSVFGKRVPLGLKVFLAALAVADDLGGIIVIALFYSSELNLPYLLGAVGLLGILVFGNICRVRPKSFYVGVGIFLWYALLNSGIHSTIAGVIVAFCVPASLGSSTFYFVERIRMNINQFPVTPTPKRRSSPSILTDEQIGLLKSIESASDHVISPLQDLEDSLQTPVNYFIIPVFAFANAGVNFDGMSAMNLFSGVGLAVFMGLLVGKVLGIYTFSQLAIRLGWVNMPEGADNRSFLSVCMLGGIGFTVSVFIADLSYSGLGATGVQLLNDAKLGILCGSLASGLISFFLLRRNLPADSASDPDSNEARAVADLQEEMNAESFQLIDKGISVKG